MIAYRLATMQDVDLLSDLLHELDATFPIPLSAKTDLTVLAEKLLINGCARMAFDHKKLVGIVGFYANDSKIKKAYISVVGVLNSYQGCGVAKRMVRDSLNICKQKGMEECFLYTHKTNSAAISLYTKLGFVAQQDVDRPDDIKFVIKL